MTNADVVKAFYAGKKAKTEHLESKGNTLYSYATCIAEIYHDSIIKNITKYSKSTSKHQGLITNYDVTVDNIPMETKLLNDYIEL